MEVNGAPELLRLPHSSEYLPLCSAEQRNSYRFGTTWGWVNADRIFIFGWTIPLRHIHEVKLFFPNITYFWVKYLLDEKKKSRTRLHFVHRELSPWLIAVIFHISDRLLEARDWNSSVQPYYIFFYWIPKIQKNSVGSQYIFNNVNANKDALLKNVKKNNWTTLLL